MIEEQLISRGIKNVKVLQAMARVPRHCFVPQADRHKAYEDTPLPIGYKQTISQPYVVAFMTEILQLQTTTRVLEIGTGSGYQSAILAEISKNVYTIEVINALAIRAKYTLTALGYTHIHYKIGDGYQGWPDEAPFEAILATCAPSHLPPAWKNQLAENGKLIFPRGDKDHQELILLEKKKHKIVEKSIFQVKFVPMTNKKGEDY